MGGQCNNVPAPIYTIGQGLFLNKEKVDSTISSLGNGFSKTALFLKNAYKFHGETKLDKFRELVGKIILTVACVIPAIAALATVIALMLVVCATSYGMGRLKEQNHIAAKIFKPIVYAIGTTINAAAGVAIFGTCLAATAVCGLGILGAAAVNPPARKPLLPHGEKV